MLVGGWVDMRECEVAGEVGSLCWRDTTTKMLHGNTHFKDEVTATSVAFILHNKRVSLYLPMEKRTVTTTQHKWRC